MRAQQILQELSVLQRQRSALEARHIRLLAEYQKLRAADGKLAARSAPEEIAWELHLGSGYAKAQVHLAEQLTERLPDTLKALEAGKIELVKARALVEITEDLSLANARKVQENVLPKAEDRTVAQVRASARYYRDRFDPDAADRRRALIRERRTADFRNHDDGEAQLSITGPASAYTWRGSYSTPSRANCGRPATNAPSKNSATTSPWICC